MRSHNYSQTACYQAIGKCGSDTIMSAIFFTPNLSVTLFTDKMCSNLKKTLECVSMTDLCPSQLQNKISDLLFKYVEMCSYYS